MVWGGVEREDVVGLGLGRVVWSGVAQVEVGWGGDGLNGMVWYGMVWYGMGWHGMVWYGMIWYGMAWYGMAWYRTV